MMSLNSGACAMVTYRDFDIFLLEIHGSWIMMSLTSGACAFDKYWDFVI